MGTDRSQKGPHQENMECEEGLRILSVAAVMATCDVYATHCPARAERLESIFLSSVLQFPSANASILLHNMHHLSCDLV